MLTTAIALLIAAHGTHQGGADTSNLSPSQILSRMFDHYAKAQSASGSIKMVQAAQGVSIETDSQIQFDRPARIFIHQTRNGSHPGEWLLTSDGKEFSYNRPDTGGVSSYGKGRYVEYVTQHDTTLALGDFLKAATFSLGDINPMIDAAVGEPTRLKNLVNKWVSLNYKGRVQINGVDVQQIVGNYREKPDQPVSGQFTAYVTDAGDFVRYELDQRFAFPKVSPQPVEVRTVWESSITVGAKTDPKLYKVITQ